MSKQCPLCGKTPVEFPDQFLESMPASWRAHLASCAGGDETRSIAVSIPFKLVRPVSMETNHVEYVNEDLGLRYRFYYPDYLDRQKCEGHIAKVEPGPARVHLEGGAAGDVPVNSLCHALMEWRALRNAQKTAEWSYQQYMQLKDESVRVAQSRISYRLRQVWRRIWYGKNPPVGVKVE